MRLFATLGHPDPEDLWNAFEATQKPSVLDDD